MLVFKHVLLGRLCAAAVHRVPRPGGLAGGTRHPRPWPPGSRPPSSGLRLPPLLPLLVTTPVAAGFQSLSLRQLCAAWRGGRPITHSSRLSNRLRANSHHHPDCGGRLKSRAPTYRTDHAPYRTGPGRAPARSIADSPSTAGGSALRASQRPGLPLIEQAPGRTPTVTSIVTSARSLGVAGVPTPRAPTNDLSNRPPGGLTPSPQLWRALKA